MVWPCWRVRFLAQRFASVAVVYLLKAPCLNLDKNAHSYIMVMESIRIPESGLIIYPRLSGADYSKKIIYMARRTSQLGSFSDDYYYLFEFTIKLKNPPPKISGWHRKISKNFTWASTRLLVGWWVESRLLIGEKFVEICCRFLTPPKYHPLPPSRRHGGLGNETLQ